MEPRSDRAVLPIITSDMPAAESLSLVERWDKRRREIEAENDVADYKLEECVIDREDTQEFRAGWDAFLADRPCHDCQMIAADDQRDWLLGWGIARRGEMLRGTE